MADWRPFFYMTMRNDLGDIGGWGWTTDLEALDHGTRMTFRLADPGAETWEAVKELMTGNVDRSLANLQEMLVEQP